jgi:hypothetical protein
MDDRVKARKIFEKELYAGWIEENLINVIIYTLNAVL